MTPNIAAGPFLTLQYPDGTKFRVFLFEILDSTNPVHQCLRIMTSLKGGPPQFIPEPKSCSLESAVQKCLSDLRSAA